MITDTVKLMMAPGKGILAADESSPTIGKRFAALNIESTEDNRRDYRELLCGTPGISQFVSGVILYEETLRQQTKSGVPFPKFLENVGILPGIKVDQGVEPLAGSPDEKITKGLEGLPTRLAEFATLGAKFTKWRAVITIIGDQFPSDACTNENAKRLAQYALDAQNAGLVPIVEPEVLLDGNHSLARCEAVTLKTLKAVFASLEEKGVQLEGMILKPNMVLAGKECPAQPSVREVAEATLRVLKAAVPANVGGVAFLSGGQDDIAATARLNEMNVIGNNPWPVTFSYSRALQNQPLKIWNGKPENAAAAQKEFFRRAKLNSLARQGKYTSEHDA